MATIVPVPIRRGVGSEVNVDRASVWAGEDEAASAKVEVPRRLELEIVSSIQNVP